MILILTYKFHISGYAYMERKLSDLGGLTTTYNVEKGERIACAL